MRTIEQMVQQEVNCCMSSLVSTLASGYGTLGQAASQDLAALAEQAFELASPVPDYEEAAIQAGWRLEQKPNGRQFFVVRTEPDAGCEASTDPESACGWEDLCRENDIEPYDREVFEHWAVSQWLAEKLIAAGEKVDTDFGGLNVWARTCSGQGIASDGVIERIHADMMKA